MALLKTQDEKNRYNSDHKLAKAAGREDIRDLMRAFIKKFRAYPVQQSRVYWRMISPSPDPVTPNTAGDTPSAIPGNVPVSTSTAQKSAEGAIKLPDLSAIPALAPVVSFVKSIPGVVGISESTGIPPLYLAGGGAVLLIALMGKR